MKWKKNEHGSKRTVKRFLLFPEEDYAGNVRWLSFETLIQEYCVPYYGNGGRWKTISFLEKVENEEDDSGKLELF
jgi:hypothetical protein